DADRVSWLELDAALAENVIQLPAVNGRVLRHMGYAPMKRHVQHDPAGDDAVGPVLDGAERRPVEGDLLLRIAPVPHRLVVPGVAEGGDVRGGDTVIEDSVIIASEGALAARDDLHVVVGGPRIVDAGLLREGTREGHAAAALDEPRRG